MAEKSGAKLVLPEKDWLTVCKTTALPLIVYGMGNGADKLADRLAASGLTVFDYIASDGFVRGQLFRGSRVLTYKEAEEKYGDFLLLVAFGTRLPDVIRSIEEKAALHPLLIPDMPIAGETFFDLPYAKAHEKELNEAFSVLADDTSRDVFSSLVSAKITGDFRELMSKVQTKDSIFSEIPWENVKSAADFGAYNGDTVRELKTYAKRLERVIAVEPDARSFKKLNAYAEEETEISVVPIHGAVGGEGVGVINASANRNSSLYNASFEHKTAPVPLLPVDKILCDCPVDYIKMDVEGAEYPALLSAKDTILRCRPILRIAAYHRSEDLHTLILFLSKVAPWYRLYLRRTPCIPAWEADIIAIPNEVKT